MSASHSLEERQRRATDAVLRYSAIHGLPGVSVGVAVDGLPVWQRGFGLANVELASPCTVDTVMRIASISKAITGVLAATMVEEGLLELDIPVQHYLPSFPVKTFNAQPVTVTSRQLLSHTGGIRPYVFHEMDEHLPDTAANRIARVPEFFSNQHYASVFEAVERFAGDELVAVPGQEYCYTTLGFTLLSAVMEAAANRGAEPGWLAVVNKM